MAKIDSVPLHRHACTSPYVFFAESMHAFLTGVVLTMHVQVPVCTPDRCCEYQHTHLLHATSRSQQDVHMCSCMCSLFHSVLGNEDAGVQLVYESTCCLAWGVIFDRKKDRGVVCVFSIFNAGGSVCRCMCVYTHTHTFMLHRWCTWMWAAAQESGWDTWTPGGPEESKWTKSRHTCIRICVQSTHCIC